MTSTKWWDATIPKEQFLKDGRMNPYFGLRHHEIGTEMMNLGAERCVVGEEVGDDGYQHFQVRVVWKKGKSLDWLRAEFPIAHWTPTTVRNFDYPEKEGNFWRSWETALGKYVDAELYPWQNELIGRLEKQNDRRVTVLIDPYGNSGKTYLAKTMVARHVGAYCPPMETAQDYMGWALAHAHAGNFVIDLPKADDAKREKGLWSAVEQMKNGYLWDKRHQWREEWIDSPGILVITNEEPNRLFLSADRWDIGHLEKGAILGQMMNIIHWERGDN